MVKRPGRPSLSRFLDVWMNGVLVGNWSVSPREGHRFAYAPTWIMHPQGRPLSLSLPLSQGVRPFSGGRVEAFFDNLLPENPDMRRRIAGHFGVHPGQSFEMLQQIGRDCAGAVQIVPAGEIPDDVHEVTAHPLSDSQIEALLDEATATMPFRIADDEFRISLAGVQNKIALLQQNGQWCVPRGSTPTTHILKLPLGKMPQGIDLSSSVENEWLCARIVQAFEIPVAHSQIARFGRYKVLVVTRFDRVWRSTWWARLPQEDFCQALGLPSAKKYQTHGGPGVDEILEILRGSSRPEIDRRDFLKTQLIFWLLAAPDGHAKNFSILLQAGERFHLAPLYDVLSAWPHVGSKPDQFDENRLSLAMGIRGKSMHYRLKDVRRRHWNAVAKRNAMGEDFENTIKQVLKAVPNVLDELPKLIPADFPASVSEPIFEGIRRQALRLAVMAES